MSRCSRIVRPRAESSALKFCLPSVILSSFTTIARTRRDETVRMGHVLATGLLCEELASYCGAVQRVLLTRYWLRRLRRQLPRQTNLSIGRDLPSMQAFFERCCISLRFSRGLACSKLEVDSPGASRITDSISQPLTCSPIRPYQIQIVGVLISACCTAQPAAEPAAQIIEYI